MSEGGTGRLSERRFGFIGGGAMAEALAGGLLASGVAPGRIQVADPDPARQKLLHEAHGLAVGADNAEAVAGCDVVV
ncbi:MAG: NAD(P)-binding domain-containing protein, partial [Myxococcales bacterium]|nr:NAD(P)-binding domain-containing protein [Myxococcales bacterium]